MNIQNPICSPAPANMAFMTRFRVLTILLICSQEAQAIALPPYNATGLFPTSIPRKPPIQNIWKNTTTTQYPPTTTAQNTTPGTKGVSGFSFHLENMEFHVPF